MGDSEYYTMEMKMNCTRGKWQACKRKCTYSNLDWSLKLKVKFNRKTYENWSVWVGVCVS